MPETKIISVSEFFSSDETSEQREAMKALLREQGGQARRVNAAKEKRERIMRATAELQQYRMHAISLKIGNPAIYKEWANERTPFTHRARAVAIYAGWMQYVDLDVLFADKQRVAFNVAVLKLGEKFMTRTLSDGRIRMWKLYTPGVSPRSILPDGVDEDTAVRVPKLMLECGLLTSRIV